MHMKFEEEEKEYNKFLRYTGWSVLIVFLAFLFFTERADASWEQTGDTFTETTYEGLGSNEFECNSGSYSMPFDCASNPDTTGVACSVFKSTNNSGFGPYIANVPANLDSQMFISGATYLDYACTGTTLTQFDVYDPPTPSWIQSGSSTSGTSSTPVAPYIPFLGGILFFFAFWSMIGIMLWTRK